MDFTESSPIETGFTPIFQQRVRPKLVSLEADRVARLRRARLYVSVALAVAIALVIGVLVIFEFSEGSVIAAIFLGAIGVIGALVSWKLQAGAWSGSVAEVVMPAVCDHVGQISYDQHAGKGFPTGEMRSLGMLQRYNDASYSDRLEGIYRGTPFEMAEARLKRETRDSDGDRKTKTVFSGLLFRIGVPISAPTQILIARDYGRLGNKLGSLFSFSGGRDLPRVEFDHDRFEAAFEVHAGSPNEARRFMPPAFLESLLAIGESEGGRKGLKGMTAGFEGDWFYLALERSRDFLKMGSLTTPVAAMEDDLHAIFDDISLIRRIIDRLHGDGPDA